MTTTTHNPQLKDLVKTLKTIKAMKPSESPKAAAVRAYAPDTVPHMRKPECPAPAPRVPADPHTLALFIGDEVLAWDRETGEYRALYTGLDLPTTTPQGMPQYIALTHFTLAGLIDSLEEARKGNEEITIAATPEHLVMTRPGQHISMTVKFRRCQPQGAVIK